MTAPLTRTRPEAAARRGLEPWTGTGRLVGILVPAAIAYVPLLLTAPGRIAADTKTYLYLDPGRLLADAPYIWDSQIGLGTVTHQNIGYLWPMGPWYWLFDALGVPDWIAQRLWLGTVLFAAGIGVRFLLRTLRWGTGAPGWGGLLVASLAYMLSPYLLDYSARISVILLPWSALPWLIALTARALRRGGWRDPAAFALVVLTVGGVNATALLLVGIGPLLWVAWAVWLERSVPLRGAVAAVSRIGVLTLVTSLWWLAGLWAQGRYGLPVLRYTETYKTVAEVATAPEVLRGLGYWFFYGSDKLGPWIEPSVTYTENVGVLTLSYLLPLAALLSAALVRWRHRAYFALLVGIGALTAIGAHPWNGPSIAGAVFKAFTRTDAGLSMRSTPRAVPLVVLGLAVFLGAGVSALGRRLPRLAVPATALVGLLVVANLPTLWRGEMVAANLERPEDLPAYWLEAAAFLDGRGHETRILEVPGADFASYRWGNTVDPITPGLLDRPYVARELFTWGSAPSANLLNAYDRRFHEGDMDPEAIAPIARVMAAGDLVARSDLQYERYRIARPRQVWELLSSAPGLGPPVVFGPTGNTAGPEQPLVDELELDAPPDLEDPPAVAAFPVLDPLPIVRTHHADRPLLVAGDGEGLVDAASIGLLDPRQASFYSASYAADLPGWWAVYDRDAELLVTDTNRRRARRWGTLRENNGYTETAGEEPLRYDPGDQRLELFPGAGDDAYTVAEQRGATVRATGYGNPITFTPNDRAVLALDGDPLTAWRVGAVDDPLGERLLIDLDQPVSTDRLVFLQPQTLVRNRWITSVRLHIDDRPPIDVALTEASRVPPGETVVIGEQTIDRLAIEVTGTDIGRRPRYDGISAVGFAEVGIPGVRVEELIRPPTDLLDRAGPSSLDHRLTFLFTRLRSNPGEPVRTDEEVALARIIDLPTERSFSLLLQGRLSAHPPDEVVDRLLGVPDASQGGITARSSERLPGGLDHRALMAVDGDPATFWNGIFDRQEGQFVEVTVPEPVTFDHLDLQLVADGRHSVPTRLLVQVDGEALPVAVELPPVEDRGEPNAVVPVRVELPRALTGRTIGVYVDAVRPVETIDWYTSRPLRMPVAIAELGIPGVQAPPVPETFDSGCRDDLVRIDDVAVPVRATGRTADAVARRPLTIVPCGEVPTVTLPAGRHVLRTAPGRDLGIDIDRIALASAPGGAPLAGSPDATRSVPSGPGVEVLEAGRVSYDLAVRDPEQPFWLAIGQSWNEGWRATVDGEALGPPQVIDGYGAGWLIDPAGRGDLRITVTWVPQRVVWIALGLSALGVLASLVLLALDRRGRGVVVVEPGTDRRRPDEPEAVLPWQQEPNPVAPRTAALAAGALGGFVALTTPVGPGLAVLAVGVAASAYVAFRHPRGAGWLALAGAGSLGLAALYIVTGQLRHDHISDFTWPLQFTRVHLFGLATVFLLLAEAVRDLLAAAPSASSEPGGTRSIS